MTERRKFLLDVAKGLVVVGAGTLVPRFARGAGGVTLATPGLCVGCHVPVAANDFVFTSLAPRPR